MEKTSYLPGDVVETAYGVGVVVQGDSHKNNKEEEESSSTSFYRVLLGRIPGRSIGSSSPAVLQPNMVR